MTLKCPSNNLHKYSRLQTPKLLTADKVAACSNSFFGLVPILVPYQKGITVYQHEQLNMSKTLIIREKITLDFLLSWQIIHVGCSSSVPEAAGHMLNTT